MSIRALLSALLLQPLLASSLAADQATCKAIWIFQLPCTDPVNALVKQVKDWSKQQCYDKQERCMYEIIKEFPGYLEIKHTSPKSYKTTVFNIIFSPPAGINFCKMKALTFSPNPNNPNDYCLLYSLISESGLTQAPGYKEISNGTMCPSKTSAKCIT